MSARLDIRALEAPVTRIRTDEDVETWKRTQGYQDYALFVRRLNEAVIGHTDPAREAPSPSPTVAKLVAVLQELARWTDDIPPRPTPQRFGNLAFRDWGLRLEQRASELIASVLPDDLKDAVPLLEPYLLTSFGSFVRIDYGTGHELAFALFLLCLSLLGLFDPTPESDRELVLVVFQEYLNTVWKLQDVYKLEPAGSHGVWGLDDFAFLGYIWGSAQLSTTPSLPSDVLHPSPATSLLPETNLYFSHINRIRKYKSGPFHEHSSQLHAIASQVPRWEKVNRGMFKMYEAEVLSKRVVVQHIPLGGLIKWDPAPTPTPATPATPAPWTTLSSSPAPTTFSRTLDAGAATNILPPLRMQAFGRGTGGSGRSTATPTGRTAMPPASVVGTSTARTAMPPPSIVGRTSMPPASVVGTGRTSMPPPSIAGVAGRTAMPPPSTGAPWASGGGGQTGAPWAAGARTGALDPGGEGQTGAPWAVAATAPSRPSTTTTVEQTDSEV
ncbi:Phosphotyrosyl phosphatase activator [Exidia glandulosa HHB12029]|uniref:Serine/threonine-protein phosphatase 2A activator n=1 Tax=Exidia glandulosa HHB12029 TaxID=1314781 RepID=A0A165J1H8_EXIGL|nr:Phosphotyrosyl phosphatase activator [Exidia glandulosa HHB12029]